MPAMSELLMRLSVLLFMIGSLGGIGLRVSPRDVLRPLTDVRFLSVGIVTNWLAAPALALLVLYLIPIDRPYAVGLLLLALAPCAPFAPAVVKIAGGDPAYLAAFMVQSAVLTVLVMPLAAPPLVGAPVDAVAIARPLGMFVLLPLLGGMELRRRSASVADRVIPALEKLTAAAGLVLLVLTMVLYGGGLLNAVGSHAIAAQLVFLVAITVVADLVGARLPASQRSVVTLGSCTRNLGAALAPVAVIEPDPRGIVMIMIAGVLTGLLSVLVARRLAHRATAANAVAAVHGS
jgi:BASS family bile acid:Na+ symporter